MDINKERELFEIEFSKIKSDISFWVNTWDEDMQGYNHPVMCWIWHIWQAAKAQAVPEGFVIFPKKQTSKMRSLARDFDARLSLTKYEQLHNIWVKQAMLEAQEPPQP